MSLLSELRSGEYIVSDNSGSLFRGTCADVTAYTAAGRALGRDLQINSQGITPDARRLRRNYIENCISVYPVGFRLRKVTDMPGMYSSALFMTEAEAYLYRANNLNDPNGDIYSVVECDWREARL